jgi:hypothetical protein
MTEYTPERSLKDDFPSDSPLSPYNTAFAAGKEAGVEEERTRIRNLVEVWKKELEQAWKKLDSEYYEAQFDVLSDLLQKLEENV